MWCRGSWQALVGEKLSSEKNSRRRQTLVVPVGAGSWLPRRLVSSSSAFSSRWLVHLRRAFLHERLKPLVFTGLFLSNPTPNIWVTTAGLLFNPAQSAPWPTAPLRPSTNHTEGKSSCRTTKGSIPKSSSWYLQDRSFIFRIITTLP